MPEGVFFDRCANTRSFHRCSLAGGGHPLAVPEKIIGLALSSIFSTAAPTRAPFICRRQRSRVLPALFESLPMMIRKTQNSKKLLRCFWYAGRDFPPLPRLSPRCARCPRQRKQPTGLFSSECFAFSCLVRIPSYDDKKNTKAVKNCFGVFGTPEGIRTPDLLVRSQTLYPTELPAHIKHSGEPLMFNAQILYHIAL